MTILCVDSHNNNFCQNAFSNVKDNAHKYALPLFTSSSEHVKMPSD